MLALQVAPTPAPRDAASPPHLAHRLPLTPDPPNPHRSRIRAAAAIYPQCLSWISKACPGGSSAWSGNASWHDAMLACPLRGLALRSLAVVCLLTLRVVGLGRFGDCGVGVGRGGEGTSRALGSTWGAIR